MTKTDKELLEEEKEAIYHNGPAYQGLVDLANVLVKSSVNFSYTYENEPVITIPAEGDDMSGKPVKYTINIFGKYFLNVEVERLVDYE